MDDGLLIRIKRFGGTSDELTPLEIQWQVVCYGWEAVGMSVIRSGLTRGGVLLKGEWSYKGVVLQGRLQGVGKGGVLQGDWSSREWSYQEE